VLVVHADFHSYVLMRSTVSVLHGAGSSRGERLTFQDAPDCFYAGCPAPDHPLVTPGCDLRENSEPVSGQAGGARTGRQARLTARTGPRLTSTLRRHRLAANPSIRREKGRPMHAVVIRVTINDLPAAQAELNELVPRVSAAPGFVAGYWISLSQDKGTSIAVFDTEAAAQALVDQAAAAPAAAVTMDSVELGEVIAHA
jgi:hypothetical protein